MRSSTDDGSQLLEPGDLASARTARRRSPRAPARARARAPRAARPRRRPHRRLRAPRAPPAARRTKRCDVDVLWIELEHVAGRARGDDGAESLAELRDVDLDRVRGCLRRIARPERLDEPVDGDDASRLERKDGQESARLLAAEGDSRLPARPRTDRAPATRAVGCPPARSVHFDSSWCFESRASHGLSRLVHRDLLTGFERFLSARGDPDRVTRTPQPSTFAWTRVPRSTPPG